MNVKKNTQLWLKYFPALTSGLFLALSFPDANISCLAFIALTPLLVSIQSMTDKESFYAGFITGMSYFLTLIYWIVPTIHVYGGLNIILASCVLILLCLYLALYPAIFTFALKKFDQTINSYYIPILAALLWVGLEYIRTYAFTGFSWGALGYSQFRNINLIQISDLTGVYGVSFLIVLVNASLALFWINYRHVADLDSHDTINLRPHKKNKTNNNLFLHIKSKKQYIIPAFYTILLVGSAYVYGGRQINLIDSQIKKAQKTKITIIQGNIKQDLKWSDEFKLKTVEKYIQLSKSQIKNQPDLVIWPETALPFYYGLEQVLSNQVNQCIQLSKTNFLVGSPAFEQDGKNIKFYNRTYMLDKFANIKGIWDKHHLIPFGEYVPFGNYLNFLGKITAQAGNFSPGEQSFIPLEFNANTLEETLDLQVSPNQKNAPDLKVTRKTGVLICFEILFPSIASEFVKNGADLLTTITNDAWFGYSSAAMQHFSIAVFRAVENHRTMARAANTGISGFIDPKGKITTTTPLFTDKAVTSQVSVLTSISFYTKYGDVFAMGSILAILAIYMVFVLKRVKNHPHRRK